MTQDIDAALTNNGWAVVDLPDPAPVFKSRDRLLDRLRDDGFPQLASLDAYHELVRSDEHHTTTSHALAKFYWAEQMGTSIISANLTLFRALLGPDLHVQRYPYLRIVRPRCPSDAAPLHRDTYYGASPYELSVIVPLTNMSEASSVRVISGSHVAPDRDYPYAQTVSADVVPHSQKHELGFAYAPRVLDAALSQSATAVPVSVGQALIFGLSLVHGAGVNESSRTRCSTDIRVANSLAPVQWSRGVRPDYFVPLSSSPITRTAKAYLAANDQS